MSELLDSTFDFVFNGKTYKVCKRDLYIERQFSLWVMSEAALALDRLRSIVPPTFLARQMEIYSAKVAGKKFEWGSEDVYNASISVDGEKQLLYLKMKRGEALGGQYVAREDIDEIKENKDKWNELMDIMYRVDYPEAYSDFLSLRQEQERVRKEEEMRKNLSGGQRNTGTTNHPAASQPETVSV